MSTNYIDIEHRLATLTHYAVTAAVNRLDTGDMEMESSAIADTPHGRVQRLVKVYDAIKPLLTILATLVIIPPSWRAALTLFLQTLEAVVAVAPQLDPGPVTIDDPKPVPVFKAGKDL